MAMGYPDWGRPGLWANVLVPPSEAVGVAKAYRRRRVFTYSTIKLVTDAAAHALVMSSDDLVPNATLTWHSTAGGTENAIDHDDETYAYSTTVLAVGEVRTMLVVDLGALKDVFLFIKHGGYGTTLPSKIYISSDCSTYSLLNEATSDPTEVVAKGSVRCIKWEIENNTTSSATAVQKLYSLEAYEPHDRTAIYINALTTDTLTLFVESGRYFLYEVIYESIPGWG